MKTQSIKTLDDYKAALSRIEQLWDAEPNTPQGKELDSLVDLVCDFEEQSCPIEMPDPNELKQ